MNAEEAWKLFEAGKSKEWLQREEEAMKPVVERMRAKIQEHRREWKLEGRMEPELWAAVPGYPFLPCPICEGIEGCDHTVPERASAALPRIVIPANEIEN